MVSGWSIECPAAVGLLNDLPPELGTPWGRITRMVAEEVGARGLLERPVEVREKAVVGFARGNLANVERGWAEFHASDVLGVIGPSVSDNWKGVVGLADEGRLPTIGIGATGRAQGEYGFNIQWGSIPDDAYLVANWLAGQGHRRVGVTYDSAWHAAEYVEHFRYVTGRYGIAIRAERRISQLATDHQQEQAALAVEELRGSGVDAIAHFGSGLSTVAIARAVKEAEWDVPRIVNGAFVVALLTPELTELMEGWVGTSLWDDDNELLAGFIESYEAKFAEPVVPELAAIFGDAARTAMEGLVRAPHLSREGLKQGLERVVMLPALSGGPRNAISFAPYDRRGIKGLDVMVLRRVSGGKCIQEGRFDPKRAPTL